MSEHVLNLVFAIAVLLLLVVVSCISMCGCVPACGGYEAADLDIDAARAEQVRAAASVDAGVPQRPTESGGVTLTITLEARR